MEMKTGLWLNNQDIKTNFCRFFRVDSDGMGVYINLNSDDPIKLNGYIEYPLNYESCWFVKTKKPVGEHLAPTELIRW